MRILFLDFDGVLNSEASFRWERRKGTKQIADTLSPIACSNLQHVLDKCADVKLVISSTWRLMHTLDYLKLKLTEYGVDISRVLDTTPQTFDGHRGREIKLWLEDHPEVTRYVIVDDNPDAFAYDDPRGLGVQTDWFDGLQIGHAYNIVTHFSK